MNIGLIEFARTKGARDKTKRRKRLLQAAGVLGGLAATGAAVRYGGAGLKQARTALKDMKDLNLDLGAKTRVGLTGMRLGSGYQLSDDIASIRGIGPSVKKAVSEYRLDRQTGGSRKQAISSAYNAFRNKQ